MRSVLCSNGRLSQVHDTEPGDPLKHYNSMPSLVGLKVHPSLFPSRLGPDLLGSIRDRFIKGRLHYDSIKQASRWLAVHQKHSPWINDPECRVIYDAAARAVNELLSPRSPVEWHGLGCGSGEKDILMLRRLRSTGRPVDYFPSDSSLPLVLTAYERARNEVPPLPCIPALCDLAGIGNLGELLGSDPSAASTRVISFFGMLPNLEPEQAMGLFHGVLGPADLLLLSANLATEQDVCNGLHRIRAQYDNLETRRWLMTFLLDLGFEASDGDLDFVLEVSPAVPDLRRIVARFTLNQPRRLEIEGEEFLFPSGERWRLFFSYRYTPEGLRCLLRESHLELVGEWVVQSGEEGVFLCRPGGS